MPESVRTRDQNSLMAKGWHFQKPVDVFEPLEVFRFPLYLENLLVLALFSVMFLIASYWAMIPFFGIRSVAFWFICVTLFMNYCFVIVEHTSHGKAHVPKLSGELVFPSHDRRLYLIAALSIFYLAGYAAAREGDFLVPFLVFAFVTYPLFFAVIVISQSLSAVVNPLNFVRALINFGLTVPSIRFYAIQAAVSVWLVFLIASFGVISGFHLFWMVPVTLTALFILFRALGVLLNSNAQKLGIAIHQNEETYRKALDAEADRARQAIITELHKMVRVHEYKKAWDYLEKHIDPHDIDSSADLFQRLSDWEDKKLAIKMGTVYIQHLVNAGDMARALRIFETTVDMANGQVRLPSGTIVATLAKTATSLRSREAIYSVLQNFEEDFPRHPATLDALVQRARLALEVADEPEVAFASLKAAKKLSEKAVERDDFRAAFTALKARQREKGQDSR